jgi:hypothetical protein
MSKEVQNSAWPGIIFLNYSRPGMGNRYPFIQCNSKDACNSRDAFNFYTSLRPVQLLQLCKKIKFDGIKDNTVVHQISRIQRA